MNARELAKTPLEDLTFSVVDTETTGMNSTFNRIIDIGIVTFKNGEVINKWESLIDPEQEITYWITHYTKLTNKHVYGKPKFNQIASKVNELLKDTVFVAHNVGFDYSFLRTEMTSANFTFEYPKVCTVLLGRKLLPQLSNAHLDALSDHFGITISNRHRALPDAEATATVLKKFLDIAKNKYNAKTFFDLEKLQGLKIDKDLARAENEPPLYGMFKNLPK